jgi:hypothetical protein
MLLYTLSHPFEDQGPQFNTSNSTSPQIVAAKVNPTATASVAAKAATSDRGRTGACEQASTAHLPARNDLAPQHPINRWRLQDDVEEIANARRVDLPEIMQWRDPISLPSGWAVESRTQATNLLPLVSSGWRICDTAKPLRYPAMAPGSGRLSGNGEMSVSEGFLPVSPPCARFYTQDWAGAIRWRTPNSRGISPRLRCFDCWRHCRVTAPPPWPPRCACNSRAPRGYVQFFFLAPIKAGAQAHLLHRMLVDVAAGRVLGTAGGGGVARVSSMDATSEAFIFLRFSLSSSGSGGGHSGCSDQWERFWKEGACGLVLYPPARPSVGLFVGMHNGNKSCVYRLGSRNFDSCNENLAQPNVINVVAHPVVFIHDVEEFAWWCNVWCHAEVTCG